MSKTGHFEFHGVFIECDIYNWEPGWFWKHLVLKKYKFEMMEIYISETILFDWIDFGI